MRRKWCRPNENAFTKYLQSANQGEHAGSRLRRVLRERNLHILTRKGTAHRVQCSWSAMQRGKKNVIYASMLPRKWDERLHMLQIHQPCRLCQCQPCRGVCLGPGKRHLRRATVLTTKPNTNASSNLPRRKKIKKKAWHDVASCKEMPAASKALICSGAQTPEIQDDKICCSLDFAKKIFGSSVVFRSSSCGSSGIPGFRPCTPSHCPQQGYPRQASRCPPHGTGAPGTAKSSKTIGVANEGGRSQRDCIFQQRWRCWQEGCKKCTPMQPAFQSSNSILRTNSTLVLKR